MEGRCWNTPHQAHEYPSTVDESATIEEDTSPSVIEGVNPNRRPRSSSTSSRPSVHTESFHEQQSFHSNTSSVGNGTGEDAVVSADQERQVLLLMLLAQVCALHDPTPKTFTIHVVELLDSFSRGNRYRGQCETGQCCVSSAGFSLVYVVQTGSWPADS